MWSGANASSSSAIDIQIKRKKENHTLFAPQLCVGSVLPVTGCWPHHGLAQSTQAEVFMRRWETWHLAWLPSLTENGTHGKGAGMPYDEWWQPFHFVNQCLLTLPARPPNVGLLTYEDRPWRLDVNSISSRTFSWKIAYCCTVASFWIYVQRFPQPHPCPTCSFLYVIIIPCKCDCNSSSDVPPSTINVKMLQSKHSEMCHTLTHSQRPICHSQRGHPTLQEESLPLQIECNTVGGTDRMACLLLRFDRDNAVAEGLVKICHCWSVQ